MSKPVIDGCTCATDMIEAATPAPPVPPVVPDSEALEPALPASMLRPDDGAWYDKDDPDDQPSGSGVVPDKPALDSGHSVGCWAQMTNGYACRRDPACEPAVAPERPRRPGVRVTDALRARAANASVPAVTDDEAATEELLELLAEAIFDDGLEWDGKVHRKEPVQWKSRSAANAVLSSLRSAGFLIVHHTKET